MHPHHRTDGRRLRLAFRDGVSSLALDLSQTRGPNWRITSAQTQSSGPGGSRASSQSSSGRTADCIADAEAKDRGDVATRLHGRLSG
jgi:hypothetical protein